MKQFKSALFLYGLCIVPSIGSAQIVDEFVCGGTNGTKPMKMWIENGHLKAYTTKQLDYGPVQITPTHYKARMSQPLMTDGSGWAETTFTIERLTGRFEFEVNANRPGAAKPFHSLGEGECTGVDGFDSPSKSKLEENNSVTATERAKENHLTGSEKIDGSQDAQNETQGKNHQDLPTQHVQTEKERLEKERAEAANVEQRKEEDRIAREKAEQERKKKEEDARIAKDKANRDAKEKVEQERRNNENGIRSSFSGWATTCAGGGKDVLYLQTSRPPTTGCTVNFKARCPNNSASVDFTQRNYIGGSCMGLGDNIRIGMLPCDAKQVQITVTSANCGL